MNFDASVYPYGSHREVVYGRRGMVCTSQTLASQAGLDMLKKGGMLLYSTCTFSVKENEENIACLLQERPDMELLMPEWDECFSHGKKEGFENCIPSRTDAGRIVETRI